MNKDKFLSTGNFTEKNWVFFSQYPRLFPLFCTFYDFDLEDILRWHQKFNCDSDTFSLIVKSLHTHICFDKYGLDFPNKFNNLEVHGFKNFMDKIEDMYRIESIPSYTLWQIEEYLIQ